MQLDQLAAFIVKEREKFEKTVNDKAKYLSLQNVTEEIHIEPSEFLQRDFHDGQSLEFLIYQGHYRVSVRREELVLRGSYDIQIKRFEGEEVKEYYNSLSAAILKAKSEEEIPF